MKKVLSTFMVLCVMMTLQPNNLVSNVRAIVNTEDVVLLENESFVYSTVTKNDKSEFVTVEYIESAKDIYIETLRTISYLEVSDITGHPLYRLPIDTRKIHLATSDLDKGKYAIKLKIKDEKKYIQTVLDKK